MRKKESPMQDTIHSIMKDGGIAATCAAIVQKGSTTITEHELVEAVTKIAAERYPTLTAAQAFARVYTEGEEARIVQQALSIAKAAEFTPMVVGGDDARDLSDESEAIAQLKELGRRRWPAATEAEQFERAITDPANVSIARRAHRRPSPTTVYAMPNSSPGSVAKSDPVPDAGSAYGELMLKAEAYRDAHPELSIAQAFSKIYNDRSNIELAKRERAESAPR
jgi:hypothetical protein